MRTYICHLLTLAGLTLSVFAAEDPLKWSNPILPQRADPHVTLHTDGWYYLTATVPEYDRIELRRARTLGGLSTAESKVIWHKHDRGAMGAHIWAPAPCSSYSMPRMRRTFSAPVRWESRATTANG